LQIWDRLPQAVNETLAVTLVSSTPEISKDPQYLREDRTHNLLRWDVVVDPKMNGENAFALQYEFKLELDKQMTIGTYEIEVAPKPETPKPKPANSGAPVPLG